MSNSCLHITDFLAKERQLFLGKVGEQLLELRTGDIPDEIRLSRAKVVALQFRLEAVFRETEARKAALVLSGVERETLSKKAGASRAEMTQSDSSHQFSKFDDWFHLKTGAWFNRFFASPLGLQSRRDCHR